MHEATSLFAFDLLLVVVYHSFGKKESLFPHSPVVIFCAAVDNKTIKSFGHTLDAIRKEQERSAIDRAKAAYGEKYDFAMMAGCKQDVSSLLHEETEIRSVREQLLQRRHQLAQQKQTPKKHRDDREW